MHCFGGKIHPTSHRAMPAVSVPIFLYIVLINNDFQIYIGMFDYLKISSICVNVVGCGTPGGDPEESCHEENRFFFL